jgi:hypothetical protein
MLVWGGSVLLLRDLSYKIGKVRLWLIVSLPFAAYLIAIVPTTMLISESRLCLMILVFFLIEYYIQIGSSFWRLILWNDLFVIATTIEQIPKTRAVIVYVSIAGLGITMLTIPLASPVYLATYPPFGTASSSFVVFLLPTW